MAKKTLVERLQNMAEVVLDAEFADTLNEAIDALLEMERQTEMLEARSMTVTVTLSPDKLKDMMNEAFVNCVGKDLEYVVQAVKEKMEREEEHVEEEATAETEA